MHFDGEFEVQIRRKMAIPLPGFPRKAAGARELAACDAYAASHAGGRRGR